MLQRGPHHVPERRNGGMGYLERGGVKEVAYRSQKHQRAACPSQSFLSWLLLVSLLGLPPLSPRFVCHIEFFPVNVPGRAPAEMFLTDVARAPTARGCGNGVFPLAGWHVAPSCNIPCPFIRFERLRGGADLEERRLNRLRAERFGSDFGKVMDEDSGLFDGGEDSLVVMDGNESEEQAQAEKQRRGLLREKKGLSKDKAKDKTHEYLDAEGLSKLEMGDSDGQVMDILRPT